MYIWELPDWPRFRWDASRLARPLAATHLKQGRLLGRLERLGFALQLEAELQATTEAAVKNAEIEGENLDRETVRSSVARRLGVPDAAPGPEDRRVEGIVEITLDATRNHAAALTRERLFAWQAALFPTGRSGLQVIRVGAWRDDAHGPMQVVAAPYSRRERVCFQARLPSVSRQRCGRSCDGSICRRPSTGSCTQRSHTFIECFSKSLDAAGHACANVLYKAEFWHRHALLPLNERQRGILNRLLDGFEGKLTARKWVTIAKCSAPTAQRDIKDLVDRGVLTRNEGGSKNTSYGLAVPSRTEEVAETEAQSL